MIIQTIAKLILKSCTADIGRYGTITSYLYSSGRSCRTTLHEDDGILEENPVLSSEKTLSSGRINQTMIVFLANSFQYILKWNVKCYPLWLCKQSIILVSAHNH